MYKQLYHYTSADGVLGILQNQKIKFMLSETTYMNDKTEGLDIYQHLETVCKQLEQENEITSLQKGDIIQYAKNNPCSYPVLCFSGKTGIDIVRCRMFSISFSEDSDSLPMWNYYGNRGYCLHFSNKLWLRIHNPTFYSDYCYVSSDNVVYSDVQKNEEIRNIILQNKDKADYKEAICTEINFKRFLYKSEDFDYEKEYRILIGIPDEKIDPAKKCTCFEIKYQNKSGIIRPYIEIELNLSPGESLLSGVTIGPLTDSQIVRNGLSHFLQDKGYFRAAANMVPSKIPVRF